MAETPENNELIPRVSHEEYARSMLHLARLVLDQLPEEKAPMARTEEKPTEGCGRGCVCEVCFSMTPEQRAAREIEDAGQGTFAPTLKDAEAPLGAAPARQIP